MTSELFRSTRAIAPSLCVSVLATVLVSGCSGSNDAGKTANQETSRPPSGVRNPVLWPKEMDEGDKQAQALLDPKSVPPEPPKPPVKTNDGLEYQDIKVGWGLSPSPNHNVMVHYTGYLADGTKFESSRDRGLPFSFIMGSGKVIKGFEQGIVGMKVGGVRKVIIPPSLGYGAEGHGQKIPPNATLTYEISLLSCDR